MSISTIASPAYLAHGILHDQGLSDTILTPLSIPTIRRKADIPLLNAETSLPDTDRFATEPSLTSEIISRNSFGRKAMKRLIVCTAVLGLAFSSAAQAKGCIKGAIVGGVAGSVAGHGKVGAAAGCVIGRHEANKADAQKAAPQT